MPLLNSSNQNNKIIISNVAEALIIKGLGLLISLFSAPALIRYFNNNEVLGVWFTMLSILIWFLNFDLGIGNGIRNQLTKDIAYNDYKSAKITLSSGFLSISVVTIILGAIGVVLLFALDLNWLFNVPNELLSKRTLRISSICVFVAIMLRFMLTFVGSIFYALQKSAVNNFIGLLVSFLQFLFIIVFKFSDVNEALIYISMWYLVSSNLPVILAGFYVFNKRLKASKPNIKCVKKDRLQQIIGIGTIFFSCQLLYMLIINTNEFLVTKIFGAAYTVEYSFYYRLNSILGMLVTLSMTPIWSVVTKALAEKDYSWLSSLYTKIKKVSLIVIVTQFISLPFLQAIFDLWLGKGVITVEPRIAVSFAVFGSVFVISTMLSTIVCGMARMRLQFWCYLIGVALKLIIDLSFNEVYPHWDLIVWSNVLVLLPYCILQMIDLNRFFREKESLACNC